MKIFYTQIPRAKADSMNKLVNIIKKKSAKKVSKRVFQTCSYSIPYQFRKDLKFDGLVLEFHILFDDEKIPESGIPLEIGERYDEKAFDISILKALITKDVYFCYTKQVDRTIKTFRDTYRPDSQHLYTFLLNEFASWSSHSSMTVGYDEQDVLERYLESEKKRIIKSIENTNKRISELQTFVGGSKKFLEELDKLK
ncbi:hypothetical protein BPT24_074 [Tenacibaculum phage pT24]|uniref:Uncharacterized protein n=1 Tax=Tenacibaculum phage pT24 TaxID=1880590 RepID=A0A1B4XWM4_9CAUD|nr:hypothetical protein HYP10_gp074 [Tenacibaculum phage pT24]BAV39197.1 hypothetical protein BPT24_074 [Tenacibaculum phage pT24]